MGMPYSFPLELRQTVERWLAEHDGAKLLTARSWKQTPYKDKSIVEISYNVYIEYGNLMLVYSLTTDKQGNPDVLGVRDKYLTVGDINIFREASDWFK